MYIQITTRCNMTCEHCGMNATHEGEDMSLERFTKILDKYEPEYITLGGGEPTINPQFKDILFVALSKVDNVWMATNGAETETSIVLAGLAKHGVLGVALSQDNYHDTICGDVVDAFMYGLEYNNFGRLQPTAAGDLREIRNVTGKEVNAGRCDFGDEGCICEDIIFKPNGDIHQCCCEDSPKIGHIDDNWDDCVEEYGECYKNKVLEAEID